MQTGRLVLHPAAKINLYLDVLGTRENGYHDILSVLVPVSLCDTLTLETAGSEVELDVLLPAEDPSDVMGWGDTGLAPEKNLAFRAARLLKEKTGCRRGVRMTLEKRIPVGGGLGGGSADAAATLTGLNELWETGLSLQELSGLGVALGCDVPALIRGRAVCMEGMGEAVTPLELSAGRDVANWWVVILNPGFRVSTRDIYERCGSLLTSGDGHYKNMISALRTGDVSLAGKNLYNGLQETVFCKYPLIRMLVDGLREAGALGALVSGSGASVFGLAREKEHAEGLARTVRESLGVPLWSWIARTLPDGVTAAHGPLEARV